MHYSEDPLSNRFTDILKVETEEEDFRFLSSLSSSCGSPLTGKRERCLDEERVCTPSNDDSFISTSDTPYMQRMPKEPERPVRRQRSGSLLDTKFLILPSTPDSDRGSSPFKPNDHFDFLHELGAGDFSEVVLAKHRKTGSLYAIKCSRKQFRGRQDRKQMLKEIELVKMLPKCEQVVKYYSAWQSDGILFTQMEYCPEGTLRDRLSSLEEPLCLEMIQSFMQDLLKGLEVIHSNGLLHLDIKPDNLFVHKGKHLKIGDFGMAASIGSWHGDEGDKVYLAPELFEEIASPAADIFSAGLILYEMLLGERLPKQGDEWQKLRSGKMNVGSHWTGATVELVRWMTHPAHFERPLATEALESSFFVNETSTSTTNTSNVITPEFCFRTIRRT